MPGDPQGDCCSPIQCSWNAPAHPLNEANLPTSAVFHSPLGPQALLLGRCTALSFRAWAPKTNLELSQIDTGSGLRHQSSVAATCIIPNYVLLNDARFLTGIIFSLLSILMIRGTRRSIPSRSSDVTISFFSLAISKYAKALTNIVGSS